LLHLAGKQAIVLRNSWFSRPAILFFALLLCAVSALLFFGSYTRNLVVPGIVVPGEGLTRVSAPGRGIISAIHVHEGEPIKAGQPVFSLSGEHYYAAGKAVAGSMEAQLALLSERRQRLRHALELKQATLARRELGLANRLQLVRAQMQGAQAEVAIQQRREREVGAVLARYKLLVQKDFIAQPALFEKQDLLENVRSQLSSARRQYLEYQANAEALESEIGQLRFDTQEQAAESANEIAAVDRDVVQLRSSRLASILAPADGVVAAIHVQAGQQVDGQALATLMPAGAALMVHAYAPSRMTGFVKAGQKVRLRYHAYPYQKFGLGRGEVVRVSAHALTPAEIALRVPEYAPGHEALYQIFIRMDAADLSIDGERVPLAAGATLDADIALERRRGIDWLALPLRRAWERWGEHF